MSNWCTGCTRSCSCRTPTCIASSSTSSSNPSRLARDITDALDRLPRGSTSISDLSSDVEEAVERGWVFGTLMFGEAQVRTGHLMVGACSRRNLRNALYAISAEFDKIKPDDLVDNFAEVVAGSPEDGQRASDGFRMGGGARRRGQRRDRRRRRWASRRR